MYTNPYIESSYRANDIGHTLYQLVTKLKPTKVVEFGCLYGYSTVVIASALRDNGQGKLHCYDLWEKYDYKHSRLQDTKATIESYGLADYVEFAEKDYYEWLANPESFDLMHLDISNTGDTIEQTYNKLPVGSKVVFEGGSIERDNAEWMIKYNARPINSIKTLVQYTVVDSNFPSLSFFEK